MTDLTADNYNHFKNYLHLDNVLSNKKSGLTKSNKYWVWGGAIQSATALLLVPKYIRPRARVDPGAVTSKFTEVPSLIWKDAVLYLSFWEPINQ